MTRSRMAAFTASFIICALTALPAAAQDGRSRVIVELRLASGPHVPEGRGASPAAIDAQRRAIADAGARVLARLQGGGPRLLHRYQTVPYLALEVSASDLQALNSAGAAQDIVRVMDDAILRPVLAQSVPLVEGDQAWATGYDGNGTTIAVLDTGVDGQHPFLSGKLIEEACYSSTVAGSSQSFCPNGLNQQLGPGAAAPCSLADCLHGTHVAGIAAGSGAAFSGVAKGARIMGVQVFSLILSPLNCGGTAPCAGAYSSDIIAGLERVYAVAAARQIVAVNLSLAGGAFAAPCDDQPYKPIIDNLRSIGVATVVATGNNGSTSNISAPACVSSAISVGSTDKNDVVSWFSNTASFMSLFAPGESILSSVPGGGYQVLSGTSMATPHVAGAWAVLRQAAPGAGVTAVLNALQQTGLSITDTRFLGTVTVPRVRIFRALATFVPVTHPSPAVTSVSPSHVPAGKAATVTITGTGFDGFSVFYWNGAARPTTVLSTTQVRGFISSADVAVPGTALVSVVNPSPGGGISGSLPVVIDPPPTLSVSAATVAPGSPATVTLTNGLGGSNDWLALAAVGSPDNTYLKWTYVGAGLSTKTWTVTMPSTAGAYEFRLFLNNGSVRTATSPTVTVDPNLVPPPPSLSASATTAQTGTNVMATLTGGMGGVADWLTLAPTSAPNTTYLQYVYVGAGVFDRTWTTAMPATPGTYEFRLFLSGGYTRGATSPPITVVPGPNPVPAVTSTLPVSAPAGAAALSLTVNGTGFVGSSVVRWNGADRVTTFVSSTQLRAAISAADLAVPGTAQITVFSPAPGGGPSSSRPFSIVSTLPTLSVSATTAQPGGSVTVTLTDGFGGNWDWLGLSAVGSPDSSYLKWTYVGAGMTTRTWTVTMPTTPGPYQFRLYLNNGSTKFAVSPTVTVGGSNP
jgi:subtilisin family serine protease